MIAVMPRLFDHRIHDGSRNFADLPGDWWVFVQDPQCPDEILLAVLGVLDGK